MPPKLRPAFARIIGRRMPDILQKLFGTEVPASLPHGIDSSKHRIITTSCLHKYEPSQLWLFAISSTLDFEPLRIGIFVTSSFFRILAFLTNCYFPSKGETWGQALQNADSQLMFIVGFCRTALVPISDGKEVHWKDALFCIEPYSKHDTSLRNRLKFVLWQRSRCNNNALFTKSCNLSFLVCFSRQPVTIPHSAVASCNYSYNIQVADWGTW